MTEFIIERTGERIRAQLNWSANGKTGEFHIYTSAQLTMTGDILRYSQSGDRFLLMEHNLNGLMFRGKPHYRAGFCSVSDTLSLWRDGDMIVADLPAVVIAGPARAEETLAQIITSQKLRIALQPTDVRTGDELRLDRTHTHVRVEKVDGEAWDGIVLVWGAV